MVSVIMSARGCVIRAGVNHISDLDLADEGRAPPSNDMSSQAGRHVIR